MDTCLYCKGRGYFRDCLSGGECYCTCPAGHQLEAKTEAFYIRMENEYEHFMSELSLMVQEYQDSYAANECGDWLWEQEQNQINEDSSIGDY
jgi:hypothetical protein